MKTIRILILILFFQLNLVGFSQTPVSEINSAIVKIDWRMLDLNVIDDSKITNGSINDFLNEKGKNYLIDNQIQLFKNLEVAKVFPFLMTTDTISISRLGNKVRIPTFWSVFKIILPYETNVVDFCTNLKKLTQLVRYAHPNYSGEYFDVPNDPLFSTNQFTFNNAPGFLDYINMDSAWNIETGKPFVKVGVFDSGIDTLNPDLDVLTGNDYFNLADGEDVWAIDYIGHGTKTAGVIGAKRNNGIGVAGIAGGNNSTSNGVSLISFSFGPTNKMHIDGAAAAIVDGARSTNSGFYDWTGNSNIFNQDIENEHKYTEGYGIHVGNHSYGFVTQLVKDETTGSGADTTNFLYTGADCNLCIEAYLFSYQNNVINVASRGNYNPDDGNIYGNEFIWPARMQDHMIISVGSNALNGEQMTPTNNSTTEIGGSYIGGNIDLIAPGTNDLVYTTASGNDNNALYYGSYNGTSSASPHVSGVVALVLSYYNKPCYSNFNLDHEDIEQMLQKTATDVDTTIGYDEQSGWGRLNARAMLDSLKKGDFQIIHPTDAPINYTITLEDTITLLGNALEDYGPFSNEPLGNLIDDGSVYYKVERYKIIATYDYSNYLIEPTTELLDVWVRKNTSTFSVYTDGTNFTPPGESNEKFKIEHDSWLINHTSNTATFEGYLYHFIEELNSINPPGFNPNIWYPVDSSNFKFDFSIYLRDTVRNLSFDSPCDSSNILIDSSASIIENKLKINIFPNPTLDNLQIIANAPLNSIQLINLEGKVLIKQENINNNQYKLQLTYLSTGIYFINVILSNGEIITKKIIKQ